MNININNYCNQKCPYCFAKDYMRQKTNNLEKLNMSFKNFRKVLLFLKKSKYYACRFEGGESTLHPQFKTFVDYAINQRFKVRLFTNGIFSEDICQFLLWKEKQVQYTWNINSPNFYSATKWKQLNRNLKTLVPLSISTLGVNIYKQDQKFEVILSLIKKYHPQNLRVCFTHPSGPSPRNQFLPSREIKNLTRRVTVLIKKVIILGTTKPLIIDCGSIFCAWHERDIGFLIKHGFDFGQCRLTPGIDPDLNVFHCFQTTDINETKRLEEFSNLQAIYKFLSEIRKRYNSVYLFKECLACKSYKLEACDGGCLAEKKYIVQRYINRLKKDIKNSPSKDRIFNLAVELERIGSHKEAVEELARIGYNKSFKLAKYVNKTPLYGISRD